MDTRSDFLRYYQGELAYLRRAGREFARRYPKIASRLELTEEGSADPHVERLLEAFAFLTARLEQRLDDEFVEVSRGLLETLQPSLTEIVPPLSIAEFTANPAKGKLTGGYTLPRHWRLFAQSRDESGRDGIACRFRTCYPVELWPVSVEAAAVDRGDRDSISITLSSTEDWRELTLDRLRFYIAGDVLQRSAIYDLMAAGLDEVRLEGDAGDPVTLPASSVSWVGFDRDEAVLPGVTPDSPAYRLLAEYIHFPQKFFFFDVKGLRRRRSEKILTIRFVLRQPAKRLAVERETFRLHCTPIVNLFSRITEPVRIDHRSAEYRLVADYRQERTTEIHSIRQVSASPDPLRDAELVEPFFSFRHEAGARGQTSFWYARRRPVERADATGTDVWLSFYDLRFHLAPPSYPVVYAHTLCTNRELAVQVGEGARLHVEEQAPVRAVTCLSRPTAPLYPPSDGAAYWRLLTSLSLNHLTFGGGEDRVNALRKMFRLYNFAETASINRQAEGLAEIAVRPAMARIGKEVWRGFSQGNDVELMVDEALFVGSSAVLFAAVMRQFFALYAGVNSFVSLTLRSRQREGDWKSWPPLAGWVQQL